MKPIFQSLVWKIGAIKITQIVEVEAGDVIREAVPDATPDKIIDIAWLYPHFADEHGKLKALVQAFVVQTPETVILVDTCVGNDKKREAPKNWSNLQTDFLIRLEQAGYSRSSIMCVLCTHLHFDHVGWNTMLFGGKWVPTFPQARYLFARQEYEYWQSRPAKELEDDHSAFCDSVAPVFKAGLADIIDLDHTIASGISLIPTPGHTPGHVSILIESGDNRAVITGDALHHPCQMKHPSWGSAYDTDRKQANDSRRQLFERFSDGKTLIIGSHFYFPTAGKAVKDGDGYKLLV